MMKSLENIEDFPKDRSIVLYGASRAGLEITPLYICQRPLIVTE